jgi:hypothetical protein
VRRQGTKLERCNPKHVQILASPVPAVSKSLAAVCRLLRISSVLTPG